MMVSAEVGFFVAPPLSGRRCFDRNLEHDDRNVFFWQTFSKSSLSHLHAIYRHVTDPYTVLQCHTHGISTFARSLTVTSPAESAPRRT